MRDYVTRNQRIIECPELTILESWEEIEAREILFGSLEGAPDERSAGVVMQSAANAIELVDYAGAMQPA
jgi:hypothetical protein